MSDSDIKRLFLMSKIAMVYLDNLLQRLKMAPSVIDFLIFLFPDTQIRSNISDADDTVM